LELSRAVREQCSQFTSDEDSCDESPFCRSQFHSGKHRCVRKSTRSASHLASEAAQQRHMATMRRGSTPSDCVEHHGDRESCEAKDHCQYRRDGRCQKRRSRR
jgi:hypothetical protein